MGTLNIFDIVIKVSPQENLQAAYSSCRPILTIAVGSPAEAKPKGSGHDGGVAMAVSHGVSVTKLHPKEHSKFTPKTSLRILSFHCGTPGFERDNASH